MKSHFPVQCLDSKLQPRPIVKVMADALSGGGEDLLGSGSGVVLVVGEQPSVEVEVRCVGGGKRIGAESLTKSGNKGLAR